jgi:hypothetical protein
VVVGEVVVQPGLGGWKGGGRFWFNLCFQIDEMYWFCSIWTLFCFTSAIYWSFSSFILTHDLVNRFSTYCSIKTISNMIYIIQPSGNVIYALKIKTPFINQFQYLYIGLWTSPSPWWQLFILQITSAPLLGEQKDLDSAQLTHRYITQKAPSDIHTQYCPKTTPPKRKVHLYDTVSELQPPC